MAKEKTGVNPGDVKVKTKGMVIIKGHNFTRKSGKKYRLIGTDYGNSWQHFEAMDEIKSLETNKVTRMKRPETIGFINS